MYENILHVQTLRQVSPSCSAFCRAIKVRRFPTKHQLSMWVTKQLCSISISMAIKKRVARCKTFLTANIKKSKECINNMSKKKFKLLVSCNLLGWTIFSPILYQWAYLSLEKAQSLGFQELPPITCQTWWVFRSGLRVIWNTGHSALIECTDSFQAAKYILILQERLLPIFSMSSDKQWYHIFHAIWCFMTCCKCG